MAQAQIRMHPEFNIREVWHLSDEEDAREHVLTSSQTDIMHVSQQTKQRITNLFYDVTAADGNCTVRGCTVGSSSRRKIQEHCESHFLVYSASCGYITSRRDSVSKHIRKIHNKQGFISQWDASSWPEFSQLNEDLPEDCPELPLNLKLFGNRCGRMISMEVDTNEDRNLDKSDRPDGTSAASNSTKDVVRSTVTKPAIDSTKDVVRPTVTMPAIAVRRVDHPRQDRQTAVNKENVTPSGVEPSPLVIVEKKVGLRRRLTRDRQTLADLQRMVKEKKEDITRTLGQLADLGEKIPVQTDGH